MGKRKEAGKDEIDFTLPPELTPYMLAQMVAKASDLTPTAIVAGYEPDMGHLWIATVNSRGVSMWSGSGPMTSKAAEAMIAQYDDQFEVARIRLYRQPPGEEKSTPALPQVH